MTPHVCTKACQPTSESVSALIDRLRTFLDGDQTALIRLFECPRCKAGIDEPCTGVRARRPAFDPRPRHHAPRLDRYIRSRGTVVLNMLQSDLNDYGDPPAEILKQLKGSKFYRHLEKIGRQP